MRHVLEPDITEEMNIDKAVFLEDKARVSMRLKTRSGDHFGCSRAKQEYFGKTSKTGGTMCNNHLYNVLENTLACFLGRS